MAWRHAYKLEHYTKFNQKNENARKQLSDENTGFTKRNLSLEKKRQVTKIAWGYFRDENFKLIFIIDTNIESLAVNEAKS